MEGECLGERRRGTGEGVIKRGILVGGGRERGWGTLTEGRRGTGVGWEGRRRGKGEDERSDRGACTSAGTWTGKWRGAGMGRGKGMVTGMGTGRDGCELACLEKNNIHILSVI